MAKRVENLSFMNEISMVMKATSDDETPIPGYLYNEISGISRKSEGTCESLLEFLVDRLNKKSCHTKYKVLKLMKYIIENGHENFKHGLRHKSAVVSEATKIGGPPDPLHGDVPYKMVRKMAKEVLDVLFDAEKVTQRSASLSGKVLPGIGMGSRSGDMVGFGNVKIEKPKSLGDTILEGIGKFADQMRESPPDPKRNILQSLERTSQNSNPLQLNEVSSYALESSQQLQNNNISPPNLVPDKPKKHIPGRAGGGWEDSDDEIDNLPCSSDKNSDHRELSDRLDTSGIEDWTMEENIIDSTVKQSSSQLLTRKEIHSFIGKCSNVNCDKIIELLNERLQFTDSNNHMKYLLLLESFLRTDMCNYDHIALSCKDNLVNIYNQKQNGVKSKARKIIRILEKLSSFREILPITDVAVPQSSTSTQATEIDPQPDGSPP